MRKIVASIILLFAGLMTLAPVMCGNGANQSKAVVRAADRQPVEGDADPANSISGRKNPELIPDNVAYSTLFRMISNRRTEEEKYAIRAYLRQVVGLGRQCEKCHQPAGTEDEDIDALLAAAEEFYQRVNVLDQQATALKDRNWPNPGPAALAELNELQKRQESLIGDAVASLPRRLSARGLQRVIQHVNGHVKQHITLTPAPSSPPYTQAWRHHSDR